MAPIAIDVHCDGEWSIIHRCTGCGALRTNRIAGDDQELALLQVVLRPLAEGRSAMMRMTIESGPSVVAVAVLAFVLTWNDLVVGLLLNWPAADQAPLIVLQQARQFATSAGGLTAQAVVLTAVPVLLLSATGRWLIRGLTQGVRR